MPYNPQVAHTYRHPQSVVERKRQTFLRLMCLAACKGATEAERALAYEKGVNIASEYLRPVPIFASDVERRFTRYAAS